MKLLRCRLVHGCVGATLVAAALAFGGGGCSRGRGVPVATLMQTGGSVQRLDGDRWRAVGIPFDFVVGDVLRTGSGSSARVRLRNGSIIRVGENARLRFSPALAPQQQEPDLSLELGSAELESSGGDVSVVTGLGPARVERGARVRVRAEDQSSTMEVLVGRAVLVKPEGLVAVEAGEGVTLKVGQAVLERFRVVIGDAVVERETPPPDNARPPIAEDSAPPPAAAEPAGNTEAAAPSPRQSATRADITLIAAEDAVIHDSRPPLSVRLRFDALCPGDATVEVGGGRRPQRLTGSGSVVLRLRAGVVPYRVRCAGDDGAAKPRGAGVLSLKRDSGNLALARTPPANSIDADGRRYTVLYQTRSPKLTLSWASAPTSASEFELHVESSAGDRVLTSAGARQQFASGGLAEGTYTWWFVTPEGKQSPKTTTTIRFDNTAPIAQFLRNGADSPRAGAIAVDGVTLEGTKVSAGPHAVAVDSHGRFRDVLEPLAGDDAVAIRVEHPRTGVHYYVRRLSR